MPKKRDKLPFMSMGVMTGRYFTAGHLNINTVARALRNKYKNMKFTIRKSSVPGLLPDKILAEYKDGKTEVDEKRAQGIQSVIDHMNTKE